MGLDLVSIKENEVVESLRSAGLTIERAQELAETEITLAQESFEMLPLNASVALYDICGDTTDEALVIFYSMVDEWCKEPIISSKFIDAFEELQESGDLPKDYQIKITVSDMISIFNDSYKGVGKLGELFDPEKVESKIKTFAKKKRKEIERELADLAGMEYPERTDENPKIHAKRYRQDSDNVDFDSPLGSSDNYGEDAYA